MVGKIIVGWIEVFIFSLIGFIAFAPSNTAPQLVVITSIGISLVLGTIIGVMHTTWCFLQYIVGALLGLTAFVGGATILIVIAYKVITTN